MYKIEVKYTAEKIASWFIQRSAYSMELEGGDSLSMLKLSKMLYYAEGCSLAVGNGSLFPEKILAEEHGPGIKEIQNKYKDSPYNIQPTEEDKVAADSIMDKDQDVLEGVYCLVGIYSAWGLRKKTRKETPWLEATHNGQAFGNGINRDVIRKYFKVNYVE